MKLGVISLVYKITTLESKGGAEVWISNFVSEHARRNHEIDLYAVKGSLSGHHITLIPSLDKPISDYYDDDFFKGDSHTVARQEERFASMVYAQVLDEVRTRESEYDVIVDSTANPTFPFNARTLKKPVLTIGHDPPHFGLNFYAKIFGWPSNNVVVFPSRFQYDRTTFIPESNKAVIQHGIDLNRLRGNQEGGDHMVWMSRIDYPHRDKGASEAMFVGNRLKRRLHLTGFVEHGSRTYFEETLKPLETQYVRLEEQNAGAPVDKSATLGSARLFLFPTQWEESFGLVMLEAMACGTPVVAYARGAVPEIVADGETGFVVNASDADIRGDFTVKKTGRDGLCEAVERIYAMKPDEYRQMRLNCRAHVEKYFTVSRMVDEYERLYATLGKKFLQRTQVLDMIKQ